MRALHYKGVDTSGESYGLAVRRLEVPRLSAPRLDVLERSVRDGAIVQAATLSSKRIEIEAVVGVDDADEESLDGQLRAIEKLFDPRLGPGWLYVRDLQKRTAAPRQYWAILDSPISEPRYTGNFAELTFSFLVPDGKSQSLQPDVESYALTAPTSQFFLPDDAGAVVGGNSSARPVWIVTNTDAAPMTEFTLRNVTFGALQSIGQTEPVFTWGTVVAGNLAQGDMLRIDTLLERVEKSTDSGASWTNELSKVGLGDPLPILVDGLRNEFEVGGFVTATLDVSYDREYLS